MKYSTIYSTYIDGTRDNNLGSVNLHIFPNRNEDPEFANYPWSRPNVTIEISEEDNLPTINLDYNMVKTLAGNLNDILSNCHDQKSFEQYLKLLMNS